MDMTESLNNEVHKSQC